MLTENLNKCFGGEYVRILETTKERQGCIKSAVRELLDIYSTKVLVSKITATSSPQAISSNCHQIMHEIGKETFLRSDGNIETALSQCAYVCGGGCLHGVVAQAMENKVGQKLADSEDLAHASIQDLEKEGSKYCLTSGQEGDRLNMRESFCHALGHLIFINVQNPYRAVAECEKMTKDKKYRRSCYYGVFMEFVGGADSFGSRSLRVSSASDLGYISQCLGFKSFQRKECFRAALYPQAIANSSTISPEKRAGTFIQVCRVLPLPQDRTTCFVWFGAYSLGGSFKNNLTKDEDMCNLLKEGSEQGSCVSGQAAHIAYTKSNTAALDFCDAKDEQTISTCYRVLIEAEMFTQSNITPFCKKSKYFDLCMKSFEEYRQETPLN